MVYPSLQDPLASSSPLPIEFLGLAGYRSDCDKTQYCNLTRMQFFVDLFYSAASDGKWGLAVAVSTAL